MLTGFVVLFLGAALAAAAPAAAIDDPTRPDARVTHGPSCNPGGLVVEVVAGTLPYTVRLATTRTPAGEDEARLEPGQTVVLRTGDVAWGETIDGRLEYAAADGSGTAYTDELEEYSFTRPTREDCAAVAQPTNPDPVPPTTAVPSAPATGTSSGSAGTGTASPSGTASSTPVPTAEPRRTDPAAPAPAEGAATPPARAVSPGESVTVEASGFRPGELVTVQLRAGGAVLGTATAGPDGTVQAAFRIPDGAAAGRTTVDLVGNESAVVADLELRIAGVERVVATDDWADLVPLTAAAVALVGSVSGLVSVAGGQRAARRHALMGSA
ncbi:MAG TPA: hypothetical protein VE463_11620 [Blastococcus sp.]|nr:hypothetical protein [Blastococcus sp.]